ncbi:MAG TPA: EthD domain-containing protein [Methylomirabilota bacterium]|nr:EthD domain-containing protein [Methylomirabilota bacterium]
MVKVITFLKRKSGMPVDEFQRYWRMRHPAVVTRLPGVRRYVQSHTLPTAYQTGEPIYYRIAEVWADDTDALRAMTRSPAYARVQADEAVFLDRSTIGYLVTDEHPVKDGPVPPEAAKSIGFLTRKPGLAVEEFQRYWREVHGPLIAAIPGVRCCVLSPTRRSAYEAGRVPAYDGVAATWFDSADGLRAATASAEHARETADRENFLAPGPPRFIVTREHVIVG